MSKQCLDVQQMQHLQELGLELKETTLYWARCVDNNPRSATHYGKWVLIKGNNAQTVGLMHWEFISAYTLQDVLDAMTRWVSNDGFCPRITIDLSERLIRYHYKDKQYVKTVMKSFDSTGCLIDAAYEMLCWSIKKKFVETKKMDKDGKENLFG